MAILRAYIGHNSATSFKTKLIYVPEIKIIPNFGLSHMSATFHPFSSFGRGLDNLSLQMGTLARIFDFDGTDSPLAALECILFYRNWRIRSLVEFAISR